MTAMTGPMILTSHSERRRLDVISVGEFFGEINWYGQTLLESDDFAPPDTPYETVGHFFATFPWQGATLSPSSDSWDDIAKDDVSAPLENDTLTLEDLSALF